MENPSPLSNTQPQIALSQINLENDFDDTNDKVSLSSGYIITVSIFYVTVLLGFAQSFLSEPLISNLHLLLGAAVAILFFLGVSAYHSVTYHSDK